MLTGRAIHCRTLAVWGKSNTTAFATISNPCPSANLSISTIQWRHALFDLTSSQDFARELLGHLNAAYKLARQLTRNGHDADDVVQEAYLRALRSATSFRGGDARPWLLRIVRNVFCDWIQRNPIREPGGREQHVRRSNTVSPDPEQALVRRTIVHKALNALPSHCREVLVLREVKELSYRDISDLLGVPRGTVMSRLSRARARLRESAWPLVKSGQEHE